MLISSSPQGPAGDGLLFLQPWVPVRPSAGSSHEPLPQKHYLKVFKFIRSQLSCRRRRLGELSAPSLRSGSSVAFGWGLVPFGGYGYGYGYPGAYGGSGGGGFGLGNVLLYGILAVFAFSALQSFLNRDQVEDDYGACALLHRCAGPTIHALNELGVSRLCPVIHGLA